MTPSATELSELVTMLTPVAPLSELPARLVVFEFVEVTLEPAVAMDVSVWPAVKLLIWLSLMGCALLRLLVAE